MKLQFIGHSSFLITLQDGTVMLTDPWFYSGWLLRREPPALFPESIKRLDILLSSHNHLDHIDAASLQLAKHLGSRVVGSLCVGKRAWKAGLRKVVALKPGEHYRKKGFSITAVPAQHPLAPHAVGFLIEAEGQTMYFSGDTRLFTELVTFLKRFKPDICFVQVSCLSFFGKEDGMTDRTAAQLVKALRPVLAIPMHYHSRFKRGDPHQFVARLAGTETKTVLMVKGEEREL